MKSVFYMCCFVSVILFFGACNKSAVYEEKSKTLDSLSGVINTIARELDKVDTLVLQKSITRYTWYKQFIEQNINDTVNKTEADHLKQFYASGKSLENFSVNRKLILTRAALMNVQLLKLGEDAKKKTLNTEELSAFSLYEKKEASKLIEVGYEQQKIYHSSLEEFKNALRGVEILIRSRNKGELPTIIKDTISL